MASSEDSAPSQAADQPTAEIIDLKFGPRPDGTMVMSHVAGRWRNAEFERRRAERDAKRTEVEQAGKERL